MESDAFFDKFISKDFEEHYEPKAFEHICKQFLIRKKRSGELVDSFENQDIRKLIKILKAN